MGQKRAREGTSSALPPVTATPGSIIRSVDAPLRQAGDVGARTRRHGKNEERGTGRTRERGSTGIAGSRRDDQILKRSGGVGKSRRAVDESKAGRHRMAKKS